MPTQPNLDFPDFRAEHAAAVSEARRRVDHLSRPGALGDRHESRRASWLAGAEARLAQLEAMDPERDRVRVRYSSGPRTRRSGDRTVAYRAGTVELVHPAEAFDYRVALDWDEGSGQLEARAVAVIARPGGPAVTATSLRKAHVGRAILDATQALTMAATDGGVERGTASDARWVLRQEGAPERRVRRRSRQEVSDEVHRVADAWHEWDRAGRVGSSRQFIAGRTGLPPRLVPERMRSATSEGLVPQAKGTRRR